MKFSKRLVSLVVAIIFILGMMPATTFAQGNETTEYNEGYADDQLLVVYDSEVKVTDKVVEADIEESGVEVETQEIMDDTILDDGAIVEMKIADDQNLDEAIEALESNPNVVSVQPNFEYQMMGVKTNDAKFSSQYYLKKWDKSFDDYCGANLTNAWGIVKTNKKVTVAVIDTGVQMSHPDLKGNLDTKHCADTSTTNIVVGKVTDELGHGTHVAGMIAATANNGIGVAGASYNAKVLPIKVFNDKGMCYSSSLYRAYQYLDELIEAGKLDSLHVINISLGGYTEGYYDKLLEQCIAEMRDKHNVITVVSGGNGDSDKNPRTDNSYPSDFDCSFSVTALEKDGTNAKWSDYNKCKDISAPGVTCLNTYNGSKYVYMSGTSCAAPLVSGIMALLWAEHPKLTVDKAIKAVEKTAHPVNKDKHYHGSASGSAGAIDAYAALKYLGSRDSQPTTKPAASTTASKKSDTTTSTSSGGSSASKSITGYAAKLSYKVCSYNGKYKKPAVTISGLTLGKDFKVTYSANKYVGTGKVTIKGIGKYTGTIKKTFKIRPKDTSIKSVASGKKSITVKWGKRTNNTSGYQIRYSTKSSMTSPKTKNVKKTGTTSLKISKLKAKKKYYVQVRTYKTVNGTKYYSKWSNKRSIKTK